MRSLRAAGFIGLLAAAPMRGAGQEPAVAPAVSPVLSATPAQAEPATHVVPVGTRVRVRTNTGWTKGTLAGGDAEALTLHTPDQGPVVIARREIRALEVHVGQRGRMGRGAFVGTVAGVVLLGVASKGDYAHSGQGSPIVTASLLLGTIIGALVKTDRWQAVPLAEVRVGLAPAPQGARVVVSIAF